MRALRALLEARAPGPAPGSPLERRLLRLLRSAGLAAGAVAQHEIRDRGRLVAIADVAFPALKLALEADGYRWHAGRARWEHDLARRNRLVALGWTVLHVTAADLDQRREETVRTIARLTARGDLGSAPQRGRR